MYTLDPKKSSQLRTRFLWNYAIVFGFGGLAVIAAIRVNRWDQTLGLLALAFYCVIAAATFLSTLNQKVRRTQSHQYDITSAFVRRLPTAQDPDVTIYWDDVTHFALSVGVRFSRVELASRDGRSLIVQNADLLHSDREEQEFVRASASHLGAVAK